MSSSFFFFCNPIEIFLNTLSKIPILANFLVVSGYTNLKFDLIY